MRHLLLAITFLIALPVSAQAQQLIGTYFATLGPQDHVNSSGTRLTDFGAILQQDRANYHRFGRVDPNDQFDPIFGDSAQRARIPSIWSIAQNSESVGVPAWVTAGNSAYVYVEIYGVGAVPSYIIVHQGAG